MPIINFDTNTVVDMGLIGEIANAVNKHDELLISFTNSALSGVEEFETDASIKRYFDPSTMAIQAGRELISFDSGDGITEITFPAEFTSDPIVTVTRGQRKSGSVPFFIHVSEVNTSSFTVEFERYDKRTSGSNAAASIFVNWIAIGQRV